MIGMPTAPKGEMVTKQLAYYFAALVILLACLGLFGLTTFARQRQKEIGIRKVLGASVGQIASLLTRDFLKLVLLAVVVVSPFAWFAMQGWLSAFTYYITLLVVFLTGKRSGSQSGAC